jgi:hypothetical protein
MLSTLFVFLVFSYVSAQAFSHGSVDTIRPRILYCTASASPDPYEASENLLVLATRTITQIAFLANFGILRAGHH